MYKVIKLFADLQDKNHVYNIGDTFPREGITVTEGRIAELAGSNNKQGVPLIAKVEEPEEAPETPEEPEEEKQSAKKTRKKAAETE